VRWFDRNGRPQTPAEASVTGVLRRAWRQRGRAAIDRSRDGVAAGNDRDGG
jgi:hypothetical protein